jgi:hypothetical protein
LRWGPPDSDPVNVARQHSWARTALDHEGTWLTLFVGTAAVATAICVARTCNNFLIFRSAFDHLVGGIDMYVPHPAEHADLFKYSPTFALLFAPFRVLPYGPALLLWNLLNVLPLFWGLRLVLDGRDRITAMQVAGLGLVSTMDGTQSNGLIAGAMVLAFAAFETKRHWAAAGTIAAATLIKLFPAAALVLAIPRRDRSKVALAFAVSVAALIGLPLLVTDLPTLVAQYRSWYAMGAVDALDRGASVMRLLHELAGYDGPNWPIQLIGTLLLLLPLARVRWSEPNQRRLMLAFTLIYCVIFNHKAEQPSYIIAIAGVSIWYAVSARGLWEHLLTALTLGSTAGMLVVVAYPAFPGGMRYPLALAAVSCSAIWLTILHELLDLAPDEEALPGDAAIVTD